MITKQQYIDYADSERKRMTESGCFASTPEFLFVWDEDLSDWIVNPNNWNGCDILRRYLYSEPQSIPGIDIKEYVIDDQTHIFIFTSGSFYEISWYKCRGKTDYIRKDGEPITMDEYLDICNRLGVKLDTGRE